jgi:hypothetical protein
MPKEIQEQGLNFYWDNEKIWSLDIPTEEIDMSELDWMLELPFWYKDEKGNVISPKEVLVDVESYPFHKEKMMHADTRYPLEITKNEQGRWIVLDGLHRLAKLNQEGNRKVNVRKIPKELIPIIEK